MKVQATQDGHYGGYYRLGPYENPDGTITPGEVFDIDATPREMKDPETGKPVQEMAQTGELNSEGRPILRPVWVLDSKGKPKVGPDGNLVPKIRMATFFSPEWMEPVNTDATVTFPQQKEPLGVLAQMVPANKKMPHNVTARPVELPDDIKAVLGGTTQKAESPI